MLCPVLDMFNHKQSVKSDPSYEYFRNTFTLTLSDRVEENEEVCINYGNRGNDELMQYYGFVVEDNKSDSYTMSGFLEKAAGCLETLGWQTSASGVKDRTEMLKASNMANDKVVVRPKRRGLTNRTLQALRILASTDEELKGKNALLDFNSQVSSENEARAYTLMRALCERELEEFPTTLEEDEKMAANLSKMRADLGDVEVKTQALQFRIQKKKVLKKYLSLN